MLACRIEQVQRTGFEVFVSDYGTIQEQYKTVLNQYQIQFEEGQHSVDKILTSKEVIKSPGIPDKVSIIKKIKAAGIPIIDEIEFGFPSPSISAVRFVK